jgi:hypothetical protein
LQNTQRGCACYVTYRLNVQWYTYHLNVYDKRRYSTCDEQRLDNVRHVVVLHGTTYNSCENVRHDTTYGTCEKDYLDSTVHLYVRLHSTMYDTWQHEYSETHICDRTYICEAAEHTARTATNVTDV